MIKDFNLFSLASHNPTHQVDGYKVGTEFKIHSFDYTLFGWFYDGMNLN